MPKVRLAPFVEEIHGKFNGVVFKKSPKGNTIMTKLADMSNVKWSKAQKDLRKRMAKANDYAHAAMADPKVRVMYEKRASKENRQPYRVAVSDYYKGKNLLARETKAPPTKKVGRKNNAKS